MHRPTHSPTVTCIIENAATSRRRIIRQRLGRILIAALIITAWVSPSPVRHLWRSSTLATRRIALPGRCRSMPISSAVSGGAARQTHTGRRETMESATCHGGTSVKRYGATAPSDNKRRPTTPAKSGSRSGSSASSNPASRKPTTRQRSRRSSSRSAGHTAPLSASSKVRTLSKRSTSCSRGSGTRGRGCRARRGGRSRALPLTWRIGTAVRSNPRAIPTPTVIVGRYLPRHG